MLFGLIPLSFLVAFGIQIVIKGVPRWIYLMISNTRMEQTISRAFIKGSAVRRETELRKKYEESFREKNKYYDIMENRGNKEIKEYEKYFEKEGTEDKRF